MSGFTSVCQVNDLIENSGVAVLVDDAQVALFYIGGDVYALSNYDPIGKANVMSRGMVGDLKGELMVASPLQKQHYSLTNGASLDGLDASIPVYDAKIEADKVLVRL